MEEFFKAMGLAFLFVLCIVIILGAAAIGDNATLRDACASNGYSKYTRELGETYCLKFNDGIISGIGLLDSEKGTVTALGISE